MYKIPEQYYLKTVDWAMEAATSELYELNDLYKVVYPAETSLLPTPKGLESARWPLECKIDEAFVAIIPYGRVVTGNCYVVTPNHKRLYDLEFAYEYPFTELPPFEYSEETIATVVWGWNLFEENIYTQNIYGHWFFDILPRFHLLEQCGIPIDKYLIGKLFHPYQYESLSLLGIPMDKLIEVDSDDYHLIAKQLLAPSVPVMLGKCPKWAYDYIRTRLKEDHPMQKVKGYDRIYITRKDAAKRYVVNEDQVIELLKKRGFHVIVLTPLSTQEKIAIFSSAQVIVAPFGSGSANIVFSEPGTKLIELSPITVVDTYFWKLCSHGEIDYYELICDVEQPPKQAVGSDNIVVDLARLEKTLQLAGL
ncbi:glycosyltransferase family 61 protein [Paenibacillus sp. RC67]|uniref:glycosyltransferase family 61 protein n=1 Tax=Paenibacillus sp. RC67 TaxID=3039392 RepID=UPI0024AE485F|nr:glycosyltransferase family 61 protein [Paenibacillus sp. RC67]